MRYPDTRNLTVESSRKKGEITWAKRFHWSLCLSAEFFLAEIYLHVGIKRVYLDGHLTAFRNCHPIKQGHSLNMIVHYDNFPFEKKFVRIQISFIT